MLLKAGAGLSSAPASVYFRPQRGAKLMKKP